MAFSRRRFIVGTVLISFIAAASLFLNGGRRSVVADTNQVYENIEIFAEVLREIEKNYVEEREPRDLIYGAIKGMVRSLDPHSAFMDKDEYKELMIETKGSFSGVGIEITIKDDMLTVVSPIEGTPAYAAGIQAGDRIIKIEGKTTKDMSMFEAVKNIRGPKGTSVTLTIVREGVEKPMDFAITRDVIPLKSVKGFLLEPEIGYLRISNFQSTTVPDMSSSLNALEEGRNLQGLILDLRNNPGGLLAQAVKVADLFLDSGVIVSTKGRDNSQTMSMSAHKNETERDYPVIVLVNGGSASAAEIVAGALQDNKRALILGSRTFGKGSVQTILPLSNGAGLRLTTARYYTPNGDSIQLSGIKPDIELEYAPPEDKEDKRPHIIREEDLKNHMPNGKADEQKLEEEKSEDEKRAEMLLKKYNQVRHALQLLKTWNIFSRIDRSS